MRPQLHSARPWVGDRCKQRSGAGTRTAAVTTSAGCRACTTTPTATVVGVLVGAAAGGTTKGGAKATTSVAARWMLGNRRQRNDEGGRRSILGDIIDVDIFEEEQGVSLIEGRERTLHFQVRNHVTKLPVKPTKEREHKGPIADGIAKLSKGTRHRL